MLEAVEGGLCLLEVLEMLTMLEVSEVMRCVLRCMLEVPEVMRLCAARMLEGVEWRVCFGLGFGAFETSMPHTVRHQNCSRTICVR